MNASNVLTRLTTARALILGMVFAALYYFAFYDEGIGQTASIAAAESRLNELNQQMQDAQQKLDNASVYKKTAAEVGNTISKLLSLIPADFKMADLMRSVSNEVKVAGSSLASIAPKKTEISAAAPEFEELSVTVELQGSFLQHMVFLSNLTKVNQILIVRKFEFSYLSDGKGDEAPTVRLSADIFAFRYRGKNSEAATQSPEGGANAAPIEGAAQ